MIEVSFFKLETLLRIKILAKWQRLTETFSDTTIWEL
jgi:hypothetical protein